MKLVLGLIALAQAGTWKRSTDETPWQEASDSVCYVWNYERYVREINDDLPNFFYDDLVIEDVNVNGTDVCVISMEGEEFDLANGYACDCSDPENFDFEDNDVCNDAHIGLVFLPLAMKVGEFGFRDNGVEYFKALVCGEPLPEFSDEEFSDDNDEEGPSLEAMCYFFNYERFAHHEAGPDDGDVPTILPVGFQFHDDVVDGEDVCVITDGITGTKDEFLCDCTNPREFMKNMYNKDVCEEAKKLAANPDEGMNQAGIDNLESLVCGFQTNFLSFGLIILCTLFKF
jgi:hypothetical protein